MHSYLTKQHEKHPTFQVCFLRQAIFFEKDDHEKWYKHGPITTYF
jgi:hypothetical protein